MTDPEAVQMTFDEFSKILEDEIALLPDYALEELSGGVLVDEKTYLHPGRIDDDLYILGTYSTGTYCGSQIVLYYGSFLAVFGNNDAAIRRQIRETLRHEVRHHLETRSGLFWKGSLVEEDKQQMHEYYMRKRKEKHLPES